MEIDHPIPVFGDFIGVWHRWFAWHPIQTYDRRWVWLRRVWRRGVQKHHYLLGGGEFWWWHQLEKPKQEESNG